jgi:hypothetical protein
MDTKWYLINEYDDRVIRGPYDTSGEAGAVRTEIERQYADDDVWNENHNLQIVQGRP